MENETYSIESGGKCNLVHINSGARGTGPKFFHSVYRLHFHYEIPILFRDRNVNYLFLPIVDLLKLILLKKLSKL
jgi:hypothetical protein